MVLKIRQLSCEDVEYLRSVAQDPGRVSLREVSRACIIWLSAQGMRVPVIAAQVKVSEHTVRLWINRFEQHGVEGLKDDPRPGKKPTYSQSEVEQILADAKMSPQDFGYSFPWWTLDSLREHLIKKRNIKMSRSRIQQILAKNGVRLNRQSLCQDAATVAA